MTRVPAAPSYLVLSIALAPRLSLWRPNTWFDLGHVDIVVWRRAERPRTFGVYASPPTKWRIFLSIFWPQATRVVRGEGFATAERHWRAWPISEEAFDRVEAFLHALAGTTRYSALRNNCFHVAVRVLSIAGVGGGRIARQWAGIFPTLGASSFLRGPMRDAVCSRMEDSLRQDVSQIDRWC